MDGLSNLHSVTNSNIVMLGSVLVEMIEFEG